MTPREIHARLDDASARALEALTSEGRNASEAVRLALVESADRHARSTALADEVRRLREDPADTRERLAVMADMNAFAGDWLTA